MSLDRHIAPSVWASPAETADHPPLSRDAAADVVVVGAGFVGLSAGLELASTGRSVVILDAGQLADGASASSAGHVGPMLYGAKKSADQVIAALGESQGTKLNRLVAESGRALFETIDRYGIACELRRGYVGVYRSEKSLARASGLFERWRAFGGRYEMIGSTEVRRCIGSDRYAGGVLLPEGGFLNPAMLQGGLAETARRSGVSIHGCSRVVAVEQDGGAWRVRTAAATVRTKQVLLAAGIGNGAIHPALAGTIYPLSCGVVATAPLEDGGRDMVPAGGPVADFDDPAIFAPAISADGRLVISFLMNGSRPDLERSARPARERLQRVFSRADIPAFQSFSWGKVQVTPDGLPRIFSLGAGFTAVTGCNGLGLTLGLTAAREAARFFCGAGVEELALPVTGPVRLPAASMLPKVLEKTLVPIANRMGK